MLSSKPSKHPSVLVDLPTGEGVSPLLQLLPKGAGPIPFLSFYFFPFSSSFVLLSYMGSFLVLLVVQGPLLVCGSGGKESACSAGDPGSISGQEDSLKEGMATQSNILACRFP